MGAFQAFLELENGAVGCVEASKIATGTNDEMTLEIRGTKGALMRVSSLSTVYRVM